MHSFVRYALFAAAALSSLAVATEASAVPLILDGSVAGPATCPGGIAVDATCQVNVAPAQNRGCRYGGVHTFDSITLQNAAFICTPIYNGADPINTGDLVLRSDTSISIDASSRITAKGKGFQGVLCDDGPGPVALSGGRGGCSVLDSGGGGAHFGGGGRGTKDCFLVAPATSCQFPQEWEEDCGALNANKTACIATTDPNFPVCYGLTNTPDGAGNALPSVAGQPFIHSIFASEFGAAGGDKGCRDGFDNTLAAGNGGGRIVLFAANAGQTGTIHIDGRVSADGDRGCASGNDSAGGGAGGTVLVVADQVEVTATARISAHGGRGGDSQPKCLPCSVNADCAAGQTCGGGRCSPCNCTPCTMNAQCDALLGQTCKNLGGALGSVCADASNACTPFDPGDNEIECKGKQNSGTCDDCAGGGGGGILNVQSRFADIHPQAIFDVRGAAGGICPICSGESGGGAGELQIDSGYSGEICDGYDNDFNGLVDDGLGLMTCPDGTTPPACLAGEPQLCNYDPLICSVVAQDARPRFALIVDTSGSMLDDLTGNPTFGDGSADFPGVDTNSDPDTVAGNNSRLFIAKNALTQVLSAFPESDFALGRYYQDVGVNRSCQSAANFECAGSCCSYDDPTNNIAPPYPATYPGNECILSNLYPGAGYPNTAAFTGDMSIGWTSVMGEDPPTRDCINYSGSCGPPRRGSQFVVGFEQPINRYLSWLDGIEDSDALFDASTQEGNHCPTGNCELRGTGPTPIAGSLEATYDFLTPIISCDSAKACRSYNTILLTDGAESCQGDPIAAAAALSSGIAGKQVKTYVIGFSVLASEQAELNAVAVAGGTGQAFFASSQSDLANALAQIIGENQKFELCNNLDDDCDTLIDEDFPEKGLPCDNGLLGVCLGTGIYQCTADGSGTHCVITNPGLPPGTEICNGLDDDCDGLIDEDATGQPLNCPTCIPSAEICDGLDNDCDGSVDEQADVAMNQPTIYGIACGTLTAPHDQTPCKLGSVLCINGGPICVGFVGPKAEICNGKDDDCDGIGDNMVTCPGQTACVLGQCVLACGSGEFPCPGGFTCVNGFCFQATCMNGEACPDGQMCQSGVCVPDGGGGAGGGGTTSSGAGSTTTVMVATGAGGTVSSGTVSPNYGLATGGGGLTCSIDPMRRDGPGSFAIVVGMLLLGRARRTRKSR